MGVCKGGILLKQVKYYMTNNYKLFRNINFPLLVYD